MRVVCLDGVAVHLITEFLLVIDYVANVSNHNTLQLLTRYLQPFELKLEVLKLIFIKLIGSNRKVSFKLIDSFKIKCENV